MNLIHFLRLLFRNAWLIIGTAAAAAVISFFIIRGLTAAFTTSTTLYIGTAAGSSPGPGRNDGFYRITKNEQFDNLVTIVKSRETLENTAIRLIAQHLVPGGADSGYCLPETRDRLMAEVPGYIKRMVDSCYLQPPQQEPEDSVPQFRTKRVYYTIKAGDSPSAVCLKFGLTLDELEALNSPMPPFQGGQRLVTGTVLEPYRADTVEVTEIAAVAGQDKSHSGCPAPERPDDKDIQYERLVHELADLNKSGQEDFIYKILHSSNPYYGIRKLSTVKVARIQRSDLIRLTFDSDDPAVCRHTLDILAGVFSDQYQSLVRQSGQGSRMQIVDHPLYPARTNTYKIFQAVIAVFFMALLILSVSIIVLEILHGSIKYPYRLKRLSGLKLIGVFPRISGTRGNRNNYSGKYSGAINHLAQQIFVEELRQKNPVGQPFILFFISTREKEGKTCLAALTAQKLRASGSKVLFVKQGDRVSDIEIKRRFTSFDQPAPAWDYEYVIPDNFITIKNITELLRNNSLRTEGYHFLIIELPALLVREYPVALTVTGNLSILVVRASRRWSNEDGEAVRLYQSSMQHPLLALLNEVR